MPVVTRLTAGKRDPSRVNVYLDESYSFSLSADLVLASGLKKGVSLTQAQLDTYKVKSTGEKVFGKILNFLSYRPRATREVRDRLLLYLKDFEDQESITKLTLSRLDSLGYLSDLEFAKWFVESRNKSRPRSVRALSYELYHKGISKEIISQVLQELGSDKSALELIIEKKQHLPPDKLMAYLARQGFPYELIKKALASRLK